MFKRLPLCAAVMTLCACSSAPVVKFPSGNAERAMIASRVRSPDSPYANASQPPTPIAFRHYYVEPSSNSLVQVLAAWSRTANLRLDWHALVDYPLNPPIRSIQEESLESALERLRAVLAGVAKPLIFSIEDGVLVVSELAAPGGNGPPAAIPLQLPAPGAEMAVSPPQKRGATVDIRVSTLFDFGGVNLNESGRSAIRRLADDLRRAERTSNILVIGHADRLGKDDANVLVALQRAITVRAELKRQLPLSEISAEGRGSSEPLIDCPGAQSPAVIACLAPNRRVEITDVTALSKG